MTTLTFYFLIWELAHPPGNDHACCRVS